MKPIRRPNLMNIVDQCKWDYLGWYAPVLMWEVGLDHEMKCKNEIWFGNSFAILP